MSANVTSARGKAGYFGREFLDQCQEFGGEPRLHGPWTRALGTEAVTAEAALERALTDGFLERRQANFTPGWVVTLTAPKDWLLVVNATHGPEEAKRVHALLHAAAEAVLRPYAEHPETRLGAGGKRRVTGTGLWFVGTELLSRNGDPQPHAHGLIVNAVQCADGRRRAFAGAHGLFLDQPLMNARFMKLVADAVREAYGLDLTRRDRAFALRDFPLDRVMAASTRTAEIDAFCRANGWTTPRQRQIATYLTRAEKREFRLEERWRTWSADTRAAVPTVESFLDRVRVAEASPNRVAARAAGHVLDAARTLTADHGPFTARQLRVESVLRSVGDPAVTLAAVERAVDRVLERPRLVGLERTDRRHGGPLFHSAEAGRTPTAPHHAAERVTLRRLAERVKAGATGVAAATAAAGRRVLVAVRRWTDDRPPVLYLRGDLPATDRRGVAGFVRRLRPMPLLAAHADALRRGLLHGRGNLVERLEQAERLFRQNRVPKERLAARQVIVVAEPGAAPRAALAALERMAAKARATVVYADTPDPTRARAAARRAPPRGRTPDSEPQRDR